MSEPYLVVVKTLTYRPPKDAFWLVVMGYCAAFLGGLLWWM